MMKTNEQKFLAQVSAYVVSDSMWEEKHFFGGSIRADIKRLLRIAKRKAPKK